MPLPSSLFPLPLPLSTVIEWLVPSSLRSQCHRRALRALCSKHGQVLDVLLRISQDAHLLPGTPLTDAATGGACLSMLVLLEWAALGLLAARLATLARFVLRHRSAFRILTASPALPSALAYLWLLGMAAWAREGWLVLLLFPPAGALGTWCRRARGGASWRRRGAGDLRASAPQSTEASSAPGKRASRRNGQGRCRGSR